MIIDELLAERGMTRYALAKRGNIPYNTLKDLCSGRTSIEKCSAGTLYRIAKELRVPMETLMESAFPKRCSFETFKSNVCHRLKNLGDIDFLIVTIEGDDIFEYFSRGWYPECLYLLAMVDYISRLNDVEICEDYDDLRGLTLEETVYPTSLLILSEVLGDEGIKEEAYANAIPEFIRFNIVENEVRNVC
ncbi:MAG: helix-turn-helix transcriptional regulator [Lachnospiraceae bacterium]|nr:helix-turn-helix transcriptional regulator [Lachnospiraceae bacterium]